MAGYTDEQLAAILEMEDLGAQEKELARAQAMTERLRGTALQPSARMDWASQAARALQGGMAGYAGMQEKKGMDAFKTGRSATLGRIKDALLGGAKRPAPAAPLGRIDEALGDPYATDNPVVW